MTAGYRTTGPTIGVGAEAPSGTSYTSNDSHSSQGLTRIGRQQESGYDSRSGLDRSASLSLAARAMKLKLKTQKGLGMAGEVEKRREVSARKQVGDAESVLSGSPGDATKGPPTQQPWWKNVTMEEGM
ncbi:hypothetical protein EJ03DRAFT_352521 [Teratosphaeria nubilosa]|uniref:Uncharacterized protein n=1 Tax=Teratosphaeria nubilosa TaxID=161662 RepID=A0A6G1L578_9PEZI|nr:hypothetical protein EJ03DRAFT_352521 [Teratosphaeria nubilosa]